MTRLEKILLSLLVASIFINYIDRGNLSIAAPLLQRELSLDPAQLGALLSAFFWTYALFQLLGVAGWLTDRYPVGLVLAGGFFVWSTATALTGWITGFAAFFAMRLLLGAGESIAYPCYSKILASDFPQEHRGFANALIDAGSKLGPSLGTLIGGVLVARLGWRWFFIVLGLASLLWLIPWFGFMPRRYAEPIPRNEPLPSVAAILGRRSAWGSFLGHFCGNYFWFFLLTWLPTYLVRERRFSMDGMATVGSIAYLAIASATVISGRVSDRLIASGSSVTRVRKSIVSGGLACATVILPVAVVRDMPTAILLLMLACVSFGVYASNHWAIIQTLAGPRAAGRWTGIMNGIGNLAGIAAPWFTGWVVDRTKTFHLAFVAAAAVALVGALMWGIMVRRVEPEDWTS